MYIYPMIKFRVKFLRLLVLFFIALSSCKHHNDISTYSKSRPQRTLKDYFDQKYLLYKLPDDYYKDNKLNQSFAENDKDLFKPMGYSPTLNLQYTHVYSNRCIYHTADTVWKFAEVCFPNTCLTKDSAYAEVTIKNTSAQNKTYYARLFYQNTTYWFPTDDSINLNSNQYLDNYYGDSKLISVTIQAGKEAIVKIPYRIGLNAKGEFNYDPDKDPARPGNYEFMVLIQPDKDDLLMSDNLDLKIVNPFAVVKKDAITNRGEKYFNNMLYVGPHHFKFVFLDEYFDKVNDITANNIYIPKNHDEKRLCDTCSGWYKGVINESWKDRDFMRGFIAKADFVKADYGTRKENFSIDTNGIKLTIPKSKGNDYKKTWGEFIFGPSFKYGHITVRAKFAQMMNETGTPNGIIHNLWLYQRDVDPIDTTNPYNYIRNGQGVQLYEIDFEIWSATKDPKTFWDPYPLITYSVVDYMRDANVKLKPKESIKAHTGESINRLTPYALAWNGDQFNKDFFNYFHTYEIYWYPDHVRFLIDGVEKADIGKDLAKIPDKHMFLWVGSPLYQDGTWYTQSNIPFLKDDKYSIIDYLKIE